MDKGVIPLVEFFSERGLKTKMSCEGHYPDKPNQSLFWIAFDESVTGSDLINFMKTHLSESGIFGVEGDLQIELVLVGRLSMSCAILQLIKKSPIWIQKILRRGKNDEKINYFHFCRFVVANWMYKCKFSKTCILANNMENR